jgi:hypothetical protein
MNLQTPLGAPEYDERGGYSRSLLATAARAARAYDGDSEQPAAEPAAPTALAAATEPTAAQPAAPPAAIAAPTAAAFDESGWRAEYAADARLRTEFGAEANYIAFKRAESQGRIRYMRRSNGAPAVTTTPPPATLPATAAQPADPDSGLRSLYRADAKLQQEFRSEANFIAFKKAEAAGRVKICRGRVNS